MGILLMVIGGYYVNGYCGYSIGTYWCVLLVIILMVISDYWGLFVVILLMVIGGYFVDGY